MSTLQMKRKRMLLMVKLNMIIVKTVNMRIIVKTVNMRGENKESEVVDIEDNFQM